MEPKATQTRLRDVKRLLVAGLAAAALTLSGCASDDPPSSSGTGEADQQVSNEPAVEVVSLNGTFRVGGGPSPGIDEPLGGTVTFDGPVTETASAVDGVFTVELPPGDYTVSASPTGNFTAATCPTGSASVEMGQTEPLAVTCVVE